MKKLLPVLAALVCAHFSHAAPIVEAHWTFASTNGAFTYDNGRIICGNSTDFNTLNYIGPSLTFVDGMSVSMTLEIDNAALAASGLSDALLPVFMNSFGNNVLLTLNTSSLVVGAHNDPSGSNGLGNDQSYSLGATGITTLNVSFTYTDQGRYVQWDCNGVTSPQYMFTSNYGETAFTPSLMNVYENLAGIVSVTDFSVTMIPEPATYAGILGALMLALAVYRRKR